MGLGLRTRPPFLKTQTAEQKDRKLRNPLVQGLEGVVLFYFLASEYLKLNAWDVYYTSVNKVFSNRLKDIKCPVSGVHPKGLIKPMAWNPQCRPVSGAPSPLAVR